MTAKEVADVRNALRNANLEDDSSWAPWPGGWPGEIEVCLVDAVYSANARYGRPDGTQGPTGVYRVIHRLRECRRDSTLNDLDALAHLLRSTNVPVLGNHQLSPGTKNLKETTALHLAEAFVAAGVRTSSNLDDYLGVERPTSWPTGATGRVPGAGPVTWEYFLMLAGHTGVKADRMIRRFVAKALGFDSVSSEDAARIVREVAEDVGVEPHLLDHAIWAHEQALP